MAAPRGHGEQPFWSNEARLGALSGGFLADVRNPGDVSSYTTGNVLLQNFGLRRPGNYQQRPDPSSCVKPEAQVVRGQEFNPTDDEKNVAKDHCSAEFMVRFVPVKRESPGRGSVAVDLKKKDVLQKWRRQAAACKMAWNKCVELDQERRRSDPPLPELTNGELDQIVINKNGKGQQLRDQYPKLSLRNHICNKSGRTVDLIGGRGEGTDAQIAQQSIKAYVSARKAAYTNAAKAHLLKDLKSRKEEEKARANEGVTDDCNDAAGAGCKRKLKTNNKPTVIQPKKYKNGDKIDEKFFPGFKSRHKPSSWTFSVPRQRIECKCCCFPTLALNVAHPLHLFPTPLPLFSIRRRASHAPRQKRLDQDAAALLSGLRGFDPGGGARGMDHG